VTGKVKQTDAKRSSCDSQLRTCVSSSVLSLLADTHHHSVHWQSAAQACLLPYEFTARTSKHNDKRPHYVERHSRCFRPADWSHRYGRGKSSRHLDRYIPSQLPTVLIDGQNVCQTARCRRNEKVGRNTTANSTFASRLIRVNSNRICVCDRFERYEALREEMKGASSHWCP
jgi:hypothetical protein